MKPITTTCVPREDVLAGTMKDDQFAAQLWDVVTDPAGYDVYGDAEQFFELTFPTNGLSKLLEMVFGRLAGDPTRGASGVIRSETSFGGGKTHGLIALHHLATGARPSNVSEFVDPELLPESCRSVAVVGEVINPVSGSKAPDGTAVRTLWGELAVQLGADAWDVLRENDRQRTAPGRDTLRNAFGDEPTVVMIDEIAHYIARCARAGNEDIRRLATTTADFLKTLFELAMSRPNVVVVFTLASVNDAFPQETEKIQQVIEKVMAESRSVAGRQPASVTPATDVEVASIVRRRLFSSIDQAAAEETAAEYAELYETAASRDLHLAGATDSPQRYAQDMVASYPFHPELLRVLDEKLSTIPQFQRTRSALRLLALTIRTVWSDAVDDALEDAAGLSEQAPGVINAADIPLHNIDVLSMLTKRLERDAFEQVAKADIVGADGHAVVVAGRNRDDKPVRVCVTTFLHSLEFTSVSGATRADRALGSLRPGDDPDALEQALDAVADVAWHLDNSTARARFSPEPNVNKIIAEEARSLATSKVLDFTEELVRALFTNPSNADAKQVMVADVFPTGGLVGVSDEQQFHLVVVDPADLTVTDATANSVPDLLQTASSKHGERPRKNQNAIGFVIADEHHVDRMHDKVREHMAATGLASSDERLAQLGSDTSRDKVRHKADESALTARIAVASCFSHIYWPTKDAAHGNLRHGALPPASKGEVRGPATDRVWDLLNQEGKVHDGALSTAYIKSKCWPASRSTIASTELEQHFWRDPSARLLIGTSALVTVIRQGAETGDWVYFHQTSGSYKYRDKGTANIALVDDGLLATPEWAADEGFLYEPPTPEEVDTHIPEAGETTTANDLRDQLETDRGGETIDKDDVVDVITTMARQGRITVTLDTPDGDKVNPSDFGKYALGRLAVSRTEEVVVKRAFRVFKGQGNVGQAFAAALASAEDRLAENEDATGIEQVAVTLDATAEAARIKSAAMVPTMEQKLALTVAVEGLTGTLPDGTGSVVIDATFDKNTVGKVKDLLYKTCDNAEDLDGTIIITCTFDTPVAPDAPDLDKLKTTLASLFQGIPVQVDGKVR